MSWEFVVFMAIVLAAFCFIMWLAATHGRK